MSCHWAAWYICPYHKELLPRRCSEVHKWCKRWEEDRLYLGRLSGLLSHCSGRKWLRWRIWTARKKNNTQLISITSKDKKITRTSVLMGQSLIGQANELIRNVLVVLNFSVSIQTQPHHQIFHFPTQTTHQDEADHRELHDYSSSLSRVASQVLCSKLTPRRLL